LIVFSGEVTTYPADGSLVRITGENGAANRKFLMDQLKSVKPDGWTNTYAAMQKAYSYQGLDTIILFSDGAPTLENAGTFDPQHAERVYSLCRLHGNIPVNAIGLGNYFDQDLSTFLRTISKITGGTFLGR
jgi:hypothetical protein